jgi:single-strand DNA-binding protein
MLNRATLIGNLGADADVRATRDGVTVVNLRVASNERFRDKNGNPQQRTEWHRVTVFGQVAEALQDYLVKGRQVYIEGKMETSNYEDSEGVQRWNTKIVVRPGRGLIQLLGARPQRPVAASSEEVDKALKSLED